MSKAVFVPTGEPGFYDLMVDRRVRAYDVESEDFSGALRRARLPEGTEVFVEDPSGYQERLGR